MPWLTPSLSASSAATVQTVEFQPPPAQVTRHLVTGEAVLWANRNVALVLFIPLSLAIEGTDWSWVAALPPQGWGVLVFTGELGCFIYPLVLRCLGDVAIAVMLGPPACGVSLKLAHCACQTSWSSWSRRQSGWSDLLPRLTAPRRHRCAPPTGLYIYTLANLWLQVGGWW